MSKLIAKSRQVQFVAQLYSDQLCDRLDAGMEEPAKRLADRRSRPTFDKFDGNTASRQNVTGRR